MLAFKRKSVFCEVWQLLGRIVWCFFDEGNQILGVL